MIGSYIKLLKLIKCALIHIKWNIFQLKTLYFSNWIEYVVSSLNFVYIYERTSICWYVIGYIFVNSYIIYLLLYILSLFPLHVIFFCLSVCSSVMRVVYITCFFSIMTSRKINLAAVGFLCICFQTNLSDANKEQAV